jgi:hypothetical protein
MIKASGTITVASINDVASTARYYLLQSSTLATPAKPTTSPPSSSWTTTEPSYTEGSTNSLYFTDETIFSDGTFAYSDVSLSSSYEAAKAAYNKAVAAANAAASLSKLIRETEDGVDVGKSADGTTYADGTSVTRQGTDGSFSILKMLSGVLTGVARFAEDAIDLGKNSITATIRMCADHLRIYGQSKDGSNDVYIMADVGADERTPCSVVLGLEDFTNDAALSNGLAIQHFVPSSGDPYDRIGLMADRYLIPGAEVTDVRFSDAIQPVVLFSGPATTGTVTLTETAADFEWMTIFYHYGAIASSVTLHSPNGWQAGLYLMYLDEPNLWVKTRSVAVSGTSITNSNKAANYALNLSNGQPALYAYYATPEIIIDRVEGRR